MWLQILCGLVALRCLRFLFSDDEEVYVEKSVSDAIFHVANRIEKLCGGKVYVGLRIPDADTGTKQTIDMVLVTKGVAMVIAVRNFSGSVDVDDTGNWVCKEKNKHRAARHPDPVVEARQQVAILESYLEQRGLNLPEGYLIPRVVLPSPTCRPTYAISDLPEVITSDKWVELKPEPKSGFSNWIKDAFRVGKGEMHDGILQQLHFILRTAPMWDRLELKSDRTLLGEFSDFKGGREDMQALRNVRRSKVGHLTVQKSSIFGVLGRSVVHVLYFPRDYRTEGTSTPEWKDATVRSSTEVLFQPIDSKKGTVDLIWTCFKIPLLLQYTL
ncbi:hypothetical protein H6P81_007405 [Aristolochia fimbriata]|uniref:NERD domain-containing protein n=1 Tax=Aristolochia fimbriata TaxID=158543 RepID=A0AAV7F3S8_ARIFI|nr:hypothetical protein H6P81_007405 [Aristolochia fimbriata]